MSSIKKKVHSIHLLHTKCLGCTHCLKVCPVQAIRIRNHKAYIDEDLCIDCGECVRVCPYQAHEVKSNDISIIKGFSYRVLIVPLTFWGQFSNLDFDQICYGLRKLGFHALVSEDIGLKLFESQIKKYAKEKKNEKRTLIAPNCPAVVRLIFVRFLSLVPDIIPVKNSEEITSKYVRWYFNDLKKIKNLGVFYLSPCSCKVSSIKIPIGERKSGIDGVFSIKDIYNQLMRMDLNEKNAPDDFLFLRADFEPNSILNQFNLLNINGKKFIIDLFDQLENNQNGRLDIINPYACDHGCWNGIFHVKNPFLAKKFFKEQKFPGEPVSIDIDDFNFDFYLEENIKKLHWVEDHEDIVTRLRHLKEIEELYDKLPKLDCGGCGSPNCYSFAQDVVKEGLDLSLCVFHSKKGEK